MVNLNVDSQVQAALRAYNDKKNEIERIGTITPDDLQQAMQIILHHELSKVNASDAADSNKEEVKGAIQLALVEKYVVDVAEVKFDNAIAQQRQTQGSLDEDTLAAIVTDVFSKEQQDIVSMISDETIQRQLIALVEDALSNKFDVEQAALDSNMHDQGMYDEEGFEEDQAVTALSQTNMPSSVEIRKLEKPTPNEAGLIALTMEHIKFFERSYTLKEIMEKNGVSIADEISVQQFENLEKAVEVGLDIEQAHQNKLMSFKSHTGLAQKHYMAAIDLHDEFIGSPKLEKKKDATTKNAFKDHIDSLNADKIKQQKEQRMRAVNRAFLLPEALVKYNKKQKKIRRNRNIRNYLSVYKKAIFYPLAIIAGLAIGDDQFNDAKGRSFIWDNTYGRLSGQVFNKSGQENHVVKSTDKPSQSQIKSEEKDVKNNIQEESIPDEYSTQTNIIRSKNQTVLIKDLNNSQIKGEVGAKWGNNSSHRTFKKNPGYTPSVALTVVFNEQTGQPGIAPSYNKKTDIYWINTTVTADQAKDAAITSIPNSSFTGTLGEGEQKKDVVLTNFNVAFESATGSQVVKFTVALDQETAANNYIGEYIEKPQLN